MNKLLMLTLLMAMCTATSQAWRNCPKIRCDNCPFGRIYERGCPTDQCDSPPDTQYPWGVAMASASPYTTSVYTTKTILLPVCLAVLVSGQKIF